MDIYLGIDFGAENIMVTYRDDSKINRLVEYDKKKSYFQNYFAIDKKTKKKYFGKDAKSVYDKDSGNNIAFFNRYKQDLVKDVADLSSYYKEQGIFPQDILREMMKYLKECIDSYLRQNVGNSINIKNSVVTVPVEWWEHDNRLRQLYRDSMKEAGFSQIQIIAEPIAAAANIIYTLRGSSDTHPKENDNMLVIDIGASTVDISLCRYKDKIEAEAGEGSEYAGNYLDALIASKVTGIDIEEILQNTNKYFKLLEKAQTLKELNELDKEEGVEDDEIKLTHTDTEKKYRVTWKHFEDATEVFTDKLIDTIGNSIDKFRGKKIGFVVVCGGMSSYECCGFEKSLFKKMKDKYQKVFEDTTFIDHTKLGSNFRNFTISYGAVALAQNPSLVKITLPYRIGIEVLYERPNGQKEYLPFYLIEHGFDYKNESKKFNLKDKLKDTSHSDASLDAGTVMEKPLVIIYSQSGQTDYSKDLAYWEKSENFRNSTEYGNVDVILSIDKNGILHADLYDISNPRRVKIATTKLDPKGSTITSAKLKL